jgi:glycosyltransferase involved in cell wall biosynthesis
MKIVHLSYTYVPEYTDPNAWLLRISFSTGVLESKALYAEVIGIYNINYKGVLNKSGVTYHFPNFKKWGLRFPFLFNNYIKRLNPDVVIVHGLISPWQIIMLRWWVGKNLKIIVQHHAERPLRAIKGWVQKRADNYISAYLFSSFDLGQLWVEKRQIGDPQKIKIVMGTSSPFYVTDKKTSKVKTGVVGDVVFLWVGGLDNNKDPLVVVRSFLRFAAQNPGISLYMIYQTYQLLEEIKLVLSSAASTAVNLIGRVNNEDLQYWYNSADFIISSSHYEGSGIAVCEGLSCGCIPILTNIPSFRMMTDNGRMGFLYEVGKEDALFAALQKSLELDREIEKDEVIKWFKEELSFNANARKIMDVIYEIDQPK